MKKGMALRSLVLFTILVFIFAGCKRSGMERGTERTKENHAPVITDVSVSPSPVSVLSPIKLSVRSGDPDGDPVKIKYSWLVNGEEVQAGGDTLGQDKFVKGDRITAILTPSDGKIEGEPYQIDIDVTNLPPRVEQIEFSPDIPVATEPLRVKARAVDPDGETVELQYAWFVDDTLIEGEHSDTLPAKYLKKGSSVSVEVIPSDDESTGKSLISQSITIANSPPRIISSPPFSISGNRYTYRVIANDPDGDAISYSLENAPEGMTIDSKSGVLNWQLFSEGKGEWTFTVIAEDAEGAKAIQTITLNF